MRYHILLLHAPHESQLYLISTEQGNYVLQRLTDKPNTYILHNQDQKKYMFKFLSPQSKIYRLRNCFLGILMFFRASHKFFYSLECDDETYINATVRVFACLF